MKTNSRIKLIALSVSAMVSLGAVAAPEAAGSDASAKQEKGQYVVRQGETLAQIAARVRPADTSLKDTIQVLAKANPNVFKNGNIHFMRVGDVLVIPSSLDIAKLNGQSGSAKPEAMADTASGGKSGQHPATVPVNPEEKEARPQSVEAESQSGGKQKADEAASAASVENKKDPGETAAASEASGEDSGSTFLWVMLGALGLLALMGLGKLKKKDGSGTAPKNEIEPPVSGPAAVAAAKSSSEKHDEDNLFSNDVEQSRVPVEAPAGDVDIDLGSLEDQGGIVSSSVTTDEETEKRRDANWDEIESTESVYEEEPQRVIFDAEKPHETDDMLAVDVQYDEQADVGQTDGDSEEPLVFESSESSEAPDALLPEGGAVAVAETGKEEKLVFESSVAADADKDISIDVDEAEADSIAEGEEKVQHIDVSPEVEPEPLDFDEPEPIKPADAAMVQTDEKPLEFVHDTVQQEDAETDEDAAAPEEPLGLGQPGLVVEPAGSTGGEEDFSETHITEADENTIIEWDSVQFGEGDEEVGFVSESVGMTAPLEAKYELAQMYIEIGDPEAARETLNELVEEANGDILAKSKALLADLN
ncbi:MAG: FimV/HubP family polar landmark protein [Neisseria sp.]|uniref:FimV/HubP family polar landmark protein n=1 Tax=Neisseria sp. TaxID=192066 RepID=UPI0026DB2279|nr:FimV/HubP family polar landmark protein [Neisseria sp.]MDO4249489.1 FimV/HubP family polar landmark protein [Neisseria sp.]